MFKFKEKGFLLVEVLMALMSLGVFYTVVMQVLLDVNLALRQRYFQQVANLARQSLLIAAPDDKKSYRHYLSTVLPHMRLESRQICWQWQGRQCVKTN